MWVAILPGICSEAKHIRFAWDRRFHWLCVLACFECSQVLSKVSIAFGCWPYWQDSWTTDWQKDTPGRAELDIHSNHWHNCMECSPSWWAPRVHFSCHSRKKDRQQQTVAQIKKVVSYVVKWSGGLCFHIAYLPALSTLRGQGLHCWC